MRLVLPLLSLLVLLPTAAARPDLPDLDRGAYEVGPCLVAYSMWWPGNALVVTCRDYTGDEMVWVSQGTCYGDFSGTTVRVLGRGVSCVPYNVPLELRDVLA